jgi:uncharacterized membrane protein YsdA (DUF1294 family)
VTISERTESSTHTSQKHYDGLEVKLLREIAKEMNATLVFQDTAPRNDSMWGTRLENGTLTGIVGDVFYGRSDIALSSMPKGFDKLEEILESTISYIDSALVWYVQCAGPHENWTSVIRMFSVSLWIMVITVYVFVCLVTVKVAGYSTKLRLKESRLYSNAIEVFGFIVGYTVAELPQTTAVRFIISLWLWYSCAFNIIFQTHYTSFLVDPGKLKQIKSVDELLESELKVSYVHELDYLYRDSNDAKDQRILQRRTYCDDVVICLDQTAIKGDSATIANNLDINYRTRNAHLLCRLDDDIFRFNIAMFMAKGSILLDRVDSIILRLIESGLLHKWMKEHKAHVGRGELRRGVNNKEDDGYFVFAVSHLSVAFGCLIFGYILSIFSFIFELIHHRFVSEKQSSVLNERNVLFVQVNRLVKVKH